MMKWTKIAQMLKWTKIAQMLKWTKIAQMLKWTKIALNENNHLMKAITYWCFWRCWLVKAMVDRVLEVISGLRWVCYNAHAYIHSQININICRWRVVRMLQWIRNFPAPNSITSQFVFISWRESCVGDVEDDGILPYWFVRVGLLVIFFHPSLNLENTWIIVMRTTHSIVQLSQFVPNLHVDMVTDAHRAK